ncbi:hypothetical protein YGS_C2P0272 [Sphingobium sp. YG1]|nr:hypothetical protein YGS_C2P0272 [Sphingobium sp. YG1]
MVIPGPCDQDVSATAARVQNIVSNTSENPVIKLSADENVVAFVTEQIVARVSRTDTVIARPAMDHVGYVIGSSGGCTVAVSSSECSKDIIITAALNDGLGARVHSVFERCAAQIHDARAIPLARRGFETETDVACVNTGLIKQIRETAIPIVGIAL